MRDLLTNDVIELYARTNGGLGRGFVEELFCVGIKGARFAHRYSGSVCMYACVHRMHCYWLIRGERKWGFCIACAGERIHVRTFWVVA